MKASLCFLLIFAFAKGFADTASELLTASDQGRSGVKKGMSWQSKVETFEEGESTIREFSVKAKEHDALIEATAPARNIGELYLFNDRNMWFFKRSLKKPVAISSRQKLAGQAANGDIASTHYARDYTATLEKSEELQGEKMQVLLLKAKSENMTYDQIRYWVSEKTKLARRAEFLTLQGTVFKYAEFEYENSLNLDGKKSPFVSKMKITDAKFKENYSVITYTNPKTEDHPAALFNVNRLSR